MTERDIERIVVPKSRSNLDIDWTFRLALADYYEELGDSLMSRFFRCAAERKLSPFRTNSEGRPDVFRWGWLYAEDGRADPWRLSDGDFHEFFRHNVFPKWVFFPTFLGACRALAEFMENQEML